MNDLIYLNTSSRRSRQRLAAMIGREPVYYYTWERGGRFARVTEKEAALASGIPGITRARFASGEEPRQCWS